MSSMNDLIFESSKVPVRGLLAPDEDGYWWVNAGAYGVCNESGVYYSEKDVQKLFENDSILKRRMQKKVVRAELGHPVWAPGMTEEMYTTRMQQIYEDRYCGHIRDAKLVKNKDGRSYITKINITPFGHYKSSLLDALTTKDANCFFSVRSLSNRQIINGVLIKYVYYVITWDFVTEGGMRIANSLDTNNLDLESMTSSEISRVTSNSELSAIDLNNTTDLKYRLKHYDEFIKSSAFDAESMDTVELVKGIISNAIVTNSGNDIFKWTK